MVLTLWDSTRMLSILACLFFLVLLATSLALVAVFGGTYNRRCVVEGTDTIQMIETFNDTSRIRPLVPERFCGILSTGDRWQPLLKCLLLVKSFERVTLD